MFSQFFCIIGFVARELHLLKVEKVELSIFCSNMVKIICCFEA
jgi:hypothetical protein